MASYLSPGVYVEEIPSAQQPIAGVGTNTVGFIGVVPDVIKVVVPNPDYDPPLPKTEAAAAPQPDNTQAINAAQADLAKANTAKTNAQSALDTATKALAADPAPTGAARSNLEQQRNQATTDVANADKAIAAANSRLGELRGPRGAAPAAPARDPKTLKPYLLVDQKIDVDPGVTVLCTNFSEYTSRFGTFSADDETTPGKAMFPGHRALTHAVYGFFRNGGTRCFVARMKSENGAEIDRALTAMESIDAVAIVAAPGLIGKDPWGRLVAHCEKTEDRFAILDPPADVEANGDVDIKALQYDTQNNVLPDRNKNAAYYFPWIEVIDPAKQLQDEWVDRNVPLKYRGRVYVAPSGHIAGIYARTDEQRGVHKAPANAAVMGAINVKYYIGKPKQDLLNPQGVNCIRNMNGNITVWGARTIGGDRNVEWKYINVRRFFLFLRESIDEGTQWVVFEPNDPTLWGKIRLNVTAFLTNVWRSGALFGVTPQEAFYVKCDAETNPPEIRDLGMVVTEIGVAIVRPAEFVIFRITQSTGLRQT